MAVAAEPLLDPAFLRRLEQWSLAVRRTTTGSFGGERRSSRHGHSIEFADFRNYVPGDDVRFVDWNLYARLERLFLKLFLHEQELNVHVLVDLSESMTFGSPSKARVARKLAAAMGVLALTHQDGLSIDIGSPMGDARSRYLRPCRGRGFMNRMMHVLEEVPEGGNLSLAQFVEQSLLRIRRPGLVVLITDFLDRAGNEPALRAILGRRHEVIALHVLDREEWEPTLRGDLKLIDSEDGAATEVSLTAGVIEKYRKRAQAWSDGLQAFCLHRGITYLRILNDTPPEDVILKALRRLGRLK